MRRTGRNTPALVCTYWEPEPQGSLFFPVVPGPQQMILHGKEGRVPFELALDLKPLAGLHLKPVTQ